MKSREYLNTLNDLIYWLEDDAVMMRKREGKIVKKSNMTAAIFFAMVGNDTLLPVEAVRGSGIIITKSINKPIMQGDRRMQQFESRGRVYSLPDTATHAAPGVCVGLYFMDGGKWFFMGDIVTDGVEPLLCGEYRGFFDHDIVELKPKRQPFAFWNKIKGAIFK